MIANRLAAILPGIRTTRAFIVLVFVLLSALLSVAFAGSPYLAPVLAFLTGVAALIDPNAHG